MTQDITKLGVEVSDGKTAEKVGKSVEQLTEIIENAAKTAKAARKELKALTVEAGGTAGSQKLAKIADQLATYSKQRGSAGLTGASARDFAAQAQGLDGLVRLYATYAANIFALGAAFRALGNAMDTKNMVAGLNQLGAAAGRNLGGLSKKVEELSGGAISMREAMTAVAQTSSGGMSSKNIERLASVARTASVALGVSMPDAISRLSRGIIKLEPELLDELGIMTRLEVATQAYAREVGKTVTQLTDFERRQAFANAVLSEGEAKFGAITEINTNPYDRLIASLKDVSQVGLNLINKILAPMASFFASSPTILGAGILALTTMIVRQALPAIGDVKQKLLETAEESSKSAKLRAAEANEAEVRITRQIAEEAEKRATIQLQAVERTEARVLALKKHNLGQFEEITKVIDKLGVKGSEITSGDILEIEEAATRKLKQAKIDEAAIYREAAVTIRNYAEAHKEAIAQVEKEKAIQIAQQKSSKLNIAGLTRELAIAAETDAIKKGIISNAAYNASLIGITKAGKIMNDEIARSNLTLTWWSKTVLQAQGYGAMFAGVLSTIGNAALKLTNAFSWIGILGTLFAGLDYLFAGSRVELNKFTKSIDDTKSSIENIDRTIIQLEKNLNSATIVGITSMANAMEDLNDNLAIAVEQARKAKKELDHSLWNRLGNAFLRMLPGNLDIDSKLADTLLNSVRNTIRLVSKSGLREEAEEKFKSLLGINVLNVKELNEALKKLSDEGVSQLLVNIDRLSKDLSNSSSRIQSFKQASDAATRAYQQFIQSTANTSPLFRAGAELQNMGASMFKSAQDVKLGADEINAAINEIAENPDRAVIFGSTFVENLVEVREMFLSQAKAVEIYKNAISKLDDEIEGSKFTQFIDTDLNKLSKGPYGKKISEGVTSLKENKKLKEELEKSVVIISEAQAKKARELFIDGVGRALKDGAELIRISLGQALEKGAIAVGKATLAGLTGEERARAENALAKQELDIQLRAIQTNIDLILSQALLRAAIDRSTASSNLNVAKQSGKTDAEIKALEEVANASNIFYEIIKGGSTPNFSNISKFTSDDNTIQQVQIRGISDSQRIAEQREAKILLDKQREALGISGAINIRSGQLEDTQKLLGLQQQVLQNDSQRVVVLNQLSGINSELGAKQQAEIDRNNLIFRQTSELAVLDTAIANARGNYNETRKQEEFKLLTQARHERELELQFLTASQRIIQASVEALNRQLDLVRAINDSTYRSGIAQMDVLNAENTAYNNLYGVSTGFAATQTEIVNGQKAQLEYVKLIGDANLSYLEKENKAKLDIARLDPTKDANKIQEINDELNRQNNLTKIITGNAKIQLETQKKILEVNRTAALQQDRYNRILSNSTKIADSLSKSFGKFGSTLGIIAEAFGSMAVNTSKNIEELKRIREEQSKAIVGSETYIRLENEYNTQRHQFTTEQLAGIASIAGASKMFFEEQSTAYRVLMAIEKAMYAAHIVMATAKIAMDLRSAAVTATTTTANVAAASTEASAFGVAAIVRTLAELPTPFNYIAAGAMAALVAGLVATIAVGGKSSKVPSIPGGITSKDMQETQGTGRRFSNGSLLDTDSGALGASTEKVTDIANSLRVIETSTSITSIFGMKMLNSLKMIEKHTKDTAAEVFKSTNIGKLASSFGTIERDPGVGGGFSLFGSKSKKVEIIDKGINVIGKFFDILQGSALFQEYETVQTTKTKSSIFGSKTKVRIDTSTRELSQLAEESIINLFDSLANSVLSSANLVLGKATEDVKKVLEDFNVDFKVSGKDLTGEQFAEEILAQSNVVMNEILGIAVPQLDLFRKLGEGFTGTLIRMGATVDSVTEKFNLFGQDIEGVVKESFKVNPETIDKMSNALTEYTNTLSDIVSTSLVSGLKNIDKADLSDQYNQFLLGVYRLELTPSIKETGFQLLPEQINEIAIAEQNLLDSRNQIVKDLGLSDVTIVSDLNLLQNTYTKAKLAILNNVDAQQDYLTVSKLLNKEIEITNNAKKDSKLGINQEVKDLYYATIGLQSGTEKVTKAFSNQEFVTLLFYNTLVEGMGGLEEFTKKTSYFFDNFYSEEERLIANTNQVTKALKSFATEGILSATQLQMLTDNTGNLREEYRSVVDSIVNSGGLLTKAGRDAYNTLVTFAPAIVDISDDIVTNVKRSLKDLLDQFNLTAGTFSEIFYNAILTDSSIEELGGEIANVIREGYIKALSSSFVESISNSFVDNIISPILSGVVNLNDSDYTTASGNFSSMVSSLTTGATNLSNMLSNPVFNQAINQATTAASIAITKLVNTVRNSDNIFSRSKLLEYTTELKDLETEFDTATIQKAIENEQTRLNLLEEQADKLKTSNENLKDFIDGLKDFKASLLVGPNSPLTPLEKLSEARAQLESAFQLSTSGATEADRLSAKEKIQDLSSSFLDTSRLVFASGAQYTADFEFVKSILDSLISSGSTQLSIDEQQLLALNSQIEASKDTIELLDSQLKLLDDSNNHLETISTRVAELNILIAREYEKGRTNIADSFTILDTNLDNILTLEELKSSGIASDETITELMSTMDINSDNQLTRLEAITSASKGTQYTIQSIVPVLEAINTGIISLNSGLNIIAEINSANTSSGLGTISGSYTSQSGISTNIVSGMAQAPTGAYISNGSVYGIGGQSMSLSDAKTSLNSLITQTAQGIVSARDVYEGLKSWGVDSSLLSTVLGVSKQDIIDWFKTYDSTIPAFAKGTNLVPEDMIAKLHKDERIIPAADNRELMESLANKNNINVELINEIRKLNVKIEKLEQSIVQGAVINAEATDRNTSEISSTIKETASSTSHTESIKRRAEIR